MVITSQDATGLQSVKLGPNLDVYELFGHGAPTSGGAGDGLNFANYGSRYTDIDSGLIYGQQGAITSPSWSLLGSAALADNYFTSAVIRAKFPANSMDLTTVNQVFAAGSIDGTKIAEGTLDAGDLTGQYVADTGEAASNVLRVASAVVDGETVTVGSDVFEVDTSNAAHITGGYIRLDLSVGGGNSPTARFAEGSILNGNATNVSDGDTVTIGSKVYTAKLVLDNVDGHYAIGGTADVSSDNLIAAINLAAGVGTLYAAATTANAARVTAQARISHTFIVQALDAGTAGNSIALLASAHNTPDAATLGTTQAGVDPTAGEFMTLFVSVFNSSNTATAPFLTARASAANSVYVFTSTAKGNGIASSSAAATATTETLAGTNNVWANATLVGGRVAGTRSQSTQTRVPTATEVSLAVMSFWVPFTTTAGCCVFTYQTTSTGARVNAITDAIVVTALTGGTLVEIRGAGFQATMTVHMEIDAS